jgi:hypothetical protein
VVRGEHCGRVWIQNENLKNRSWNRSVVKIRKKKKKEKERKKRSFRSGVYSPTENNNKA